jgi:ribosome maturation protein Sdo1
MQAIQRMTARQRHRQQQKKYRQLIAITQQVVDNAREVLEKTKDTFATETS